MEKQKGRGRGRRLGTKANRPPLEFKEGDDDEKVSTEKVQSKIYAFTVRQDESKSPIQVSRRRDDDGDYYPQDDEDEDDEVVVLRQRVTGRVLRQVKRHTVDEESVALDLQLSKCGLNQVELLAMTKDDKKAMIKIFQESQQVAEVSRQKKEAFCKEADISYEALESEHEKVAKGKQSTSETISAAQGAPDEEDETQAPEDDFKMTFGQTLDEDADHKQQENGGDGSQHSTGVEAGIENDEEETQPYELEQDLRTRLMSKKRSFNHAESDEAVPKKSKVEEDASPRPRFHFEFEENKDLPPPSPIPAKLVNKRRLKQKKSKRPFLMFAPSGEAPVEYKKKIIQYFDQYFITLREVQCRSSTMLAWGDPVCEGRHMHDSLDVFSGKPVARPVYKPKPLFSFSDDEHVPQKQKTSTNMTFDDVFGFESFDEPKPSNSRADRYEKRKKQMYGEYDDIFEEDDFTRDPDFTLARKPASKKGKGKIEGKNSNGSKETYINFEEAAKSHVFSKSTTANATHSEEDILPDLYTESDETPPLPDSDSDSDSSSIVFDGLTVNQCAESVKTPSLLHGGSNEESDSMLNPPREASRASSRNVECNISAGSSKSTEKMDVDGDADYSKSSEGRKRSSLFIGDNAKQRIKVALKTSCEKITSSRENSQNDKSEEKVNIPAEKLTLSNKIKRKIQSIFSLPATKSKEDRSQEAAENDLNLNRSSGGVQVGQGSVDNSPQASQDMFSNDTQEFDEPIPSPTFPGTERHGERSDIRTDSSESCVNSVGNVLPGGFVRAKEASNSDSEPKWFVQEQDPDGDSTNYLDNSDANVKRTAMSKRGGSRSTSNGTRDKPMFRHTDSNVPRTKVELSDNKDPVPAQHKKPPVGRRKNVASSASGKTNREEDGENDMEAGTSRSTRRPVVRPPQKKRKVEAEDVNFFESEKDEDPMPQQREPQVDCPLCSDPYPMSKIEEHASECDGISQKSDKIHTRSASSASTQENQQPDQLQHTLRLRNLQPEVKSRKTGAARFSGLDSDSDDPGHPMPPATQLKSVVPDLGPEDNLFDFARQVPAPRRARKPKPIVDGEACYICDGIYNKGKEYEEHVNSCMEAQHEEQQRIMKSFRKERSPSLDNVDGGDEPRQSGYDRQSNDDVSEESGSTSESDGDTTDHDNNTGQGFKREDENDFDWDNISSSPIKTFRPFSKHQGQLLVDLNKQFPHQRKKVELNNQRTLSEFGVRGGASGRGRGGGRRGKQATKRKRKAKRKTKPRKKAKTVKKGPPPVHFG